MCGRAKLPDDVSEIKLDLKIDWDEIGNYRPRWNAAPPKEGKLELGHQSHREFAARLEGIDAAVVRIQSRGAAGRGV